MRACDDQNHKDKEKKSVHVVNLAWPNAVENEEELNEDASKGENSTEYKLTDPESMSKPWVGFQHLRPCFPVIIEEFLSWLNGFGGNEHNAEKLEFRKMLNCLSIK